MSDIFTSWTVLLFVWTWISATKLNVVGLVKWFWLWVGKKNQWYMIHHFLWIFKKVKSNGPLSVIISNYSYDILRNFLHSFRLDASNHPSQREYHHKKPFPTPTPCNPPIFQGSLFHGHQSSRQHRKPSQETALPHVKIARLWPSTLYLLASSMCFIFPFVSWANGKNLPARQKPYSKRNLISV